MFLSLRGITKKFGAVSALTAPCGPSPMWQWASTRPGITHASVATVSAPVATGT